MGLIERNHVSDFLRSEISAWQKEMKVSTNNPENFAYNEGAFDEASGALASISEMPEVDAAKILRLIDEVDDIVSALYRQGANKDYKCKSIREKLKEIEKELTGNADDRQAESD